MKIKNIIFPTILLASQLTNASDLALDYAKDIEKQINFVEMNQSKVWPGFHPGFLPSVIVIKKQNDEDLSNFSSFSYALNYEPGILPWQKIDSLKGLYYLEDATPLKINEQMDDTIQNIDGLLSYVDFENLNYLQGQINLRNKHLENRALHYILDNPGIERKHFHFTDTAFDDFNSTYYLKLLYLEENALVVSQSAADLNKAEQALRDAVAIHQYRNSLLSKSSQDFINGMEILAGTPAFIGWTSKQLSEVEFRKMSQRTGCLPLSPSWGVESLIQCALSQFHAYSGAVFGHALDEKIQNEQWKKELIHSFKSIPNLVINYYHFTDKESEELTEKAMVNKDYEFNRISRVIEQTMTPYLTKLNAVKSEIRQHKNIPVQLELEFGLYVYASNLVLGGVFEDCFILSSNEWLIYNTDFDFSDDNVGLAFKKLPFIILHFNFQSINKDDWSIPYTQLNLSEEAELILDGKVYRAQDLIDNKLDLQFYSSITMEDKFFHYQAKESGRVYVENDAIRIEMNADELENMIKLLPLKAHYLFNKFKRGILSFPLKLN